MVERGKGKKGTLRDHNPGLSKVTFPGEAPCQRACPAGIDIPQLARLMSASRFQDAHALVHERIPSFPLSSGYVCAHPCEAACRLGETTGNPLAAKALHRFAAEQNLHSNHRTDNRNKSGKRIAIIGSGPAGLSAGYDLLNMGHEVTVFEAMTQGGGMLSLAIPDYRLPSRIVNKEIEDLKALGLEIRTGTSIDESYTIRDIFSQGYSAVLVAVGAQVGGRLPIPGAALQGVLTGLSFLRNVKSGERPEIGSKVLILGGGNVALDCARTAIRLGAREVSLVCLESLDRMPADPSEIKEGTEEGIKIFPSTTLTRIIGTNGHVSEVMSIGVRDFRRNQTGAVEMHPVAGSEKSIATDTVIFAVGQAPDFRFLAGLENVSKKGNLLSVNPETLMTETAGLFAAGDIVNMAGSVVEAVEMGRRAAASIHRYLTGVQKVNNELPAAGPDCNVEPEVSFLTPTADGLDLPVQPVRERISNFDEVEMSVTDKGAADQARRCLKCDLPIVADPVQCRRCFVCQIVCSIRDSSSSNPSNAKINIGKTFEIADGYRTEVTFTEDCDGCGLCVRYCPYGALARGNKEVPPTNWVPGKANFRGQ